MTNTFVTKWHSSVKFLSDRSVFLSTNSSHSTRLNYSGVFFNSGPGSSGCLFIRYWYKVTLLFCVCLFWNYSKI